MTDGAFINKRRASYEIMHGNKAVCSVTHSGVAQIYEPKFMPYDLYFEEGCDLDTAINNLEVFYHWCACRVLSLDREYAKELFNSIGVRQAVTDRDRAMISLSYHCVSLTDVFWVREVNEEVDFDEINLYDHHLNAAIVDLSLKGRQMTVTNSELAPDLSTHGVFPKAWIRDKEGFSLLKDGGEEHVKKELLASRICRCFDFPQVLYEEDCYDGEPVTKSRIITDKSYSMVSKYAFDIYAVNRDMDGTEECARLDPVGFYGMNILDYLVGNVDRHPENWGLLVDNATNEYISLYPLMDFNLSFGAYDSIDGSICQTVRPRAVSQRTAAAEAVRKVGLRQIAEVDPEIFGEFRAEKEMFFMRLEELKRNS